MTKFLPITEEHVRIVENEEVATLLRTLSDAQKRHVYGVEIDGTCMALCAVHVYAPGIARAWWTATINKSSSRKTIQLIKACKDQLKRICASEKVHRVEASTIVGKLKEARFMEVLDFCAEGIMYSYGGPKKDHILWAKVYA